MPLVLHIEDQQMTLIARDKRYDPRQPDDAALTVLTGFAARYAALVPKKENRKGLLALGRELFAWLDGETGDLTDALQRCAPPLVLAVTCLSRKPTPFEAAVLDAPWEILADASGFLAEDAGRKFSPVRRLQSAQEPPAPDKNRLGLVFMAASPRGQNVLDYEAEEAAIIAAVGEQHIDLVVEESGELAQLAYKLAAIPPMTVLHLSCHGSNTPPRLALEDEKGGCLETGAADLTLELDTGKFRLLFLSACLTAASQPGDGTSDAAQSLAAALAHDGMPAVLGWNGSVGDAAAKLFAKELYAQLAKRQPLEHALFAARFRLLQNTELERNDWHLARLWLGAQGGGVLVGGSEERSLLPATHGQKEFLGKTRDVPVASHEMFVGRRRELKEGLRVLANGDKAGLLLLGMGRLGKSSLAARLANRCRDAMSLAVVFGRFAGASAILQALADALDHSCEAQKIIHKWEARVAQDPALLEEALRELVCVDDAPCRQKKPVLLVVDDLEQILEVPAAPTDRHRVAPAYAAVIRAVLRAFSCRTKSRLIFTSRYAFGLGGLEARLHTIQLAAFRDEEQRKLLLHQRSAAGPRQAEGKARDALARRALTVSRGNPGLQDLLVGKFVLNPRVPLDRAGSALGQMEACLAGGELPQEEQSRRFLEEIALDALLALAGDAGKDLLRAATLFEVPVPETIVALLADAIAQGNVLRLRGLGLLEPSEDLFDPSVTALAVNALAATRLASLTEAEAGALAAIVAQPLFAAWGGADRGGETHNYRHRTLPPRPAGKTGSDHYRLRLVRVGRPRAQNRQPENRRPGSGRPGPMPEARDRGPGHGVAMHCPGLFRGRRGRDGNGRADRVGRPPGAGTGQGRAGRCLRRHGPLF